MKKYSILIVMLLLLISSLVSAQDELNIYLQTAAKNNPGLKAKFNEYMAALEIAPQVKALPDPNIVFGYFIQPVETRVGPQRFKISVAQMFPWFGTLKSKENAAVQQAKAKYEVFEDARASLFNEVRSNYYNLYFNKKAIDITIENIEILVIFQKLATIKVEAGIVSAVDEYRIEMEIGDLENQLARLRDNQFVLEVMFNKLLNVDYDNEVLIPDILWESDFNFSRQTALDSIRTSNHQLLSINFQSIALSYKRDVASKMGNPGFSLGLDYIAIGKGDNNLAGTDAFMFPKVGITIPLYRSKYKAMVQEVIYLEVAKENEKIERTNVLEVLFENWWKEYRDAERRVQLYFSQSALAHKALNLLETQYATGNSNFEEVLRMERKVLKYNLELEKARADKQAAISFITYLMGN
ncbi:MAG: hypothetical protein CL661_04810 [Bacteroidetes bacterium]|nr:hypothetical protein [Bacteroidota bacterium]